MIDIMQKILEYVNRNPGKDALCIMTAIDCRDISDMYKALYKLVDDCSIRSEYILMDRVYYAVKQ